MLSVLYIILIIRRKRLKYYYKTKTSKRILQQVKISVVLSLTLPLVIQILCRRRSLTQLEEVAGRICEWLDRE